MAMTASSRGELNGRIRPMRPSFQPSTTQLLDWLAARTHRQSLTIDEIRDGTVLLELMHQVNPTAVPSSHIIKEPTMDWEIRRNFEVLQRGIERTPQTAAIRLNVALATQPGPSHRLVVAQKLFVALASGTSQASPRRLPPRPAGKQTGREGGGGEARLVSQSGGWVPGRPTVRRPHSAAHRASRPASAGAADPGPSKSGQRPGKRPALVAGWAPGNPRKTAADPPGARARPASAQGPSARPAQPGRALFSPAAASGKRASFSDGADAVTPRRSVWSPASASLTPRIIDSRGRAASPPSQGLLDEGSRRPSRQLTFQQLESLAMPMRRRGRLGERGSMGGEDRGRGGDDGDSDEAFEAAGAAVELLYRSVPCMTVLDEDVSESDRSAYHWQMRIVAALLVSTGHLLQDLETASLAPDASPASGSRLGPERAALLRRWIQERDQIEGMFLQYCNAESLAEVLGRSTGSPGATMGQPMAPWEGDTLASAGEGAAGASVETGTPPAAQEAAAKEGGSEGEGSEVWGEDPFAESEDDGDGEGDGERASEGEVSAGGVVHADGAATAAEGESERERAPLAPVEVPTAPVAAVRTSWDSPGPLSRTAPARRELPPAEMAERVLLSALARRASTLPRPGGVAEGLAGSGSEFDEENVLRALETIQRVRMHGRGDRNVLATSMALDGMETRADAVSPGEHFSQAAVDAQSPSASPRGPAERSVEKASDGRRWAGGGEEGGAEAESGAGRKERERGEERGRERGGAAGELASDGAMPSEGDHEGTRGAGGSGSGSGEASFADGGRVVVPEGEEGGAGAGEGSGMGESDVEGGDADESALDELQRDLAALQGRLDGLDAGELSTSFATSMASRSATPGHGTPVMGSPLKTRQGEGNGPVAGSSNNPFISPETRAGSAKPQQRGEEAGRGEDDPWQGRGPTGGNGDEETPGSAPGDIYGNPFDSAGRGGAPVRDGVSLSVDAEAEPSIAETGGSGEGGSQVALGGREGNGGDAAAVSDFGAGVGGGGDGEREGVGEDRARMLKSKPSVIALKHSVIVTASGEVYVGEVRAGFMDGHGVFHFGSGGTYQGQWRQGQYHGWGVESFRDGTTYMGGFERGARHGKGRYSQVDGRQYLGAWEGGARSGWGTQQMPDGAQYFGRFAHDKREGPGVLRQPNGDVFLGCFSTGDMHGPGAFWVAATKDLIIGTWDKGLLEGKGIVKQAVGGYVVGQWAGGSRLWATPLAPGSGMKPTLIAEAGECRKRGLMAAAVAARCVVHLSGADGFTADPALSSFVSTLRTGPLPTADIDQDPLLCGQMESAPGEGYVDSIETAVNGAIEAQEKAAEARGRVLASGKFDEILAEYGLRR